MSKHIHIHVHRKTRDAGEFREEDHPRRKDGKFGSGGGGKSAPAKSGSSEKSGKTSTETSQLKQLSDADLKQYRAKVVKQVEQARKINGGKPMAKDHPTAKALERADAEIKRRAMGGKQASTPASKSREQVEKDVRKKYAGMSKEELAKVRTTSRLEQSIVNQMVAEQAKPAPGAVPGQRGLPSPAVGWQGKAMTATKSVTAPGGTNAKPKTFREVLDDPKTRPLVNSIEEYISDLRRQPGRKEHIEGLQYAVKELEKKSGYKYQVEPGLLKPASK